MMKKLIIIALLGTMAGLCSAKKVVATMWEEEKFQDPDSIYILSYKYDIDSKLFYLFTNDSESLYIHARLTDENLQGQLLMGGLNVWLDPMAKGKKSVGVKFPLPANDRDDDRDKDREMGMNKGNRRSRPSSKDLNKERIAKVESIGLVNFPGKQDLEFISVLDKQGVTGALEISEMGYIYYSLKIPFH